MRKKANANTPRIPAIGEAKRGTEGYLAYLLRQASASVRLALDRALADLDVTSPQFSVLTIISAYPDLSGADLARLTFLTPQTINVIVGNLERRGAVVKQPHPIHGRILRLMLTAEGKQLLRRCKNRADQIEKHLRTELSAADEQAVRRWLVRLAVTLPSTN